jgi:hypothetical protein
MNERPLLSGVSRPIGLRFSVALVFILFAFVLCAPHNAQAATRTWDAGGIAGDASDPINWNGNTQPAAGDDIRFDNSGQSPLENIFLNGDAIINSVTINLTVASNQNWNLGADNSTSPFGVMLTTGNISVLSTSGSGTYIIGATSGTLKVATSLGSALGTTSAITVNSGGTLLLGASNQINNTAPITLAGGTFARGDFGEGSTSTAGAGALTLSATGSHLDFGTGIVGTLTFASFSPGSFSLTIDNWTAAGTDRLVFYSDQSANLSRFNFTGYAAGAFEIDLGGGYYEITPVAPVPEPATYVAGALALGALAYHQRRRFRRRRIRR